MRAHQLVEPFPFVGMDDDGREAARRMADEHRPGLIVLDEAGRPHAVLPGSQVLHFLIPGYVHEDPALARALPESASDEMVAKLARIPVRELLARHSERTELPVVDGDATTLEIAALMARSHSPLVAVVSDGACVGAITVSRLLRHLLGTQEVQA